MIINNFNVKLFNFLNEMIYIVDFETNETIFENDVVNYKFKDNTDFNFICENILNFNKDDLINCFNLQDKSTTFVRINNNFKYNSEEYCLFATLDYFEDKKVIIYFLILITDKNKQEIFENKNDSIIQIIDKDYEIYKYIYQILSLISGAYDNFIAINNQEKLNNHLKTLNSKKINYLGILSIKINNFNEKISAENKENGIALKIKGILEKFFRINDIYLLEKDRFIVLCENISKVVFYQKVYNLNSYVLDEEEFSFSVGMLWKNVFEDTTIYNLVTDVNNLMEKAELEYKEKCKTAPTYFSIGIESLTSDKEVEILEDIYSYLGIADNSILHNKVLEKFYKKVKRLLEKDKKFVMIMVDINNFKSINELYGYNKGNEILHLLNNILALNVKNKGVCVHFHSDVYYMFFESNSDKETIEMLYNVNNDVSNVFKEMNISLLYGVYRVEDVKLPIEKMCERANYAHKNVKKGGKSTNFIFYYKDIKDELIYEKEIENSMKNALTSNQFKLYFQPKYNIFANAINGAESLVRWEHPEKGLLSPNKFIPIFEKNGFILKLDFYIFEETCKFIKKRLVENKKIVPISINMSKLHFKDQNFKYNILSLIRKYKIPTNLIEIEVTESLLASNIDQIINIIKELKEKGLKISIDDFGTGYSSLSILKDLDIDTLKIDSSFFKGFQNNKKSELVIRHIVSLGNALKMNVVAEGVETEEEVNYLKEINCSTVQGYYFSKPIPLEEYEKLMDNE